MSLRVVEESSIRPFEHIQCPVCGGHAFTEIKWGGVWCDVCNAQFKVRNTAGDPGSVVDCFVDGLATAYERAMVKRGLFVKRDTYPWNGHAAGVYFYKIMKDPREDGSSGDESTWILSSLPMAPERMVYADKETRRPIWEHMSGPLIPKEEANMAAEELKAERPTYSA